MRLSCTNFKGLKVLQKSMTSKNTGSTLTALKKSLSQHELGEYIFHCNVLFPLKTILIISYTNPKFS